MKKLTTIIALSLALMGCTQESNLPSVKKDQSTQQSQSQKKEKNPIVYGEIMNEKMFEPSPGFGEIYRIELLSQDSISPYFFVGEKSELQKLDTQYNVGDIVKIEEKGQLYSADLERGLVPECISQTQTQTNITSNISLSTGQTIPQTKVSQITHIGSGKVYRIQTSLGPTNVYDLKGQDPFIFAVYESNGRDVIYKRTDLNHNDTDIPLWQPKQ